MTYGNSVSQDGTVDHGTLHAVLGESHGILIAVVVYEVNDMSKLWAVVNADGRIFAGVSSTSGRAMWFDCDGDLSHMADVEALRRKRDARWLALAKRFDATAEWGQP